MRGSAIHVLFATRAIVIFNACLIIVVSRVSMQGSSKCVTGTKLCSPFNALFFDSCSGDETASPRQNSVSHARGASRLENVFDLLEYKQ